MNESFGWGLHDLSDHLIRFFVIGLDPVVDASICRVQNLREEVIATSHSLAEFYREPKPDVDADTHPIPSIT